MIMTLKYLYDYPDQYYWTCNDVDFRQWIKTVNSLTYYHGGFNVYNTIDDYSLLDMCWEEMYFDEMTVIDTVIDAVREDGQFDLDDHEISKIAYPFLFTYLSNK